MLHHLIKTIFTAFLLLAISALGIAQPMPKTTPALTEIFNEAESIPSLRSLLIQQQGELVGEKYFRNTTPTRPYNIKSASKSIISLLIGIAVDQKLLSIDQTLGEFFPEYFAENDVPIKEKITIRQLLSMQAGLETTSFYNYGAWVISDNWVEFQLDQPLTEEPGGTMVYSTGTSHLLSVILTKASGTSTRSFANTHLFKPLGIRVGGWDRDPQGYYMGGNNLALTPQALLKIGSMMLNEGVYKGKRIVSTDWVRASFATYTRSNYNPYDYGYMWWNREVGGVDVYFAWGYGGQYIFMLPELESVVVITSSLRNASQRRTYKEPIFNLLENELIPYLESR